MSTSTVVQFMKPDWLNHMSRMERQLWRDLNFHLLPAQVR